MLSKAIERVRMTVETPEVAPTVPTLKLLSHRTCFFQGKRVSPDNLQGWRHHFYDPLEGDKGDSA